MLRTRIVQGKPAMVLEGDEKILIISDIHAGFEDGMAANGIRTGKRTAIGETISDILEMVDAEGPDSVVFLGDVKSSVSGIGRSEWDDIPRLFSEVGARCGVVLVPGNHDAGIQRLLPEGVTVTSPAGIVEQGVLLTHGHRMPSGNLAHVDGIVMGHLHPVYFEEGSLLNGQRVWVYLRAQRDAIFPGRSGEIEITIVPSFNRYFYAEYKRRRKRSISPIIDRVKEVSAARIVTLDGVIIGDESAIGRVV